MPTPTCCVVYGGHLCLLVQGHDGPHECMVECAVKWTDDDMKED